jgi:hypothetical protein
LIDAPRHVGPGRFALRLQQLGDFVQGHDETADAGLVAVGLNSHEEAAHGAVGLVAGNLRLADVPWAPARLLH